MAWRGAPSHAKLSTLDCAPLPSACAAPHVVTHARPASDGTMSGADFAGRCCPTWPGACSGSRHGSAATNGATGSRGSLAVHCSGAPRGTWHDFEADARRRCPGPDRAPAVQTDKAGALAWLVDARLIATPAGADVRPAAPPRPAAVPSNRGKPCRNAARAPGSLPESPLRRPVSGPRGPGGTWTRPENPPRPP